MSSGPVSLLYATAGSGKEAERIALHLLKKRLIACANIFPIRSLYRWKGKIEKAGETGMLLKTSRVRVPAVIRELASVHSYEVPCTVELPVGRGNRKYLSWIIAESQDGKGRG